MKHVSVHRQVGQRAALGLAASHTQKSGDSIRYSTPHERPQHAGSGDQISVLARLDGTRSDSKGASPQSEGQYKKAGADCRTVVCSKRSIEARERPFNFLKLATR